MGYVTVIPMALLKNQIVAVASPGILEVTVIRVPVVLIRPAAGMESAMLVSRVPETAIVTPMALLKKIVVIVSPDILEVIVIRVLVGLT